MLLGGVKALERTERGYIIYIQMRVKCGFLNFEYEGCLLEYTILYWTGEWSHLGFKLKIQTGSARTDGNGINKF